MLKEVTSRIKGWNWALPYDYLPGMTLIVLFLSYTYTVSPYLFLYFLCGMSTMFLIIISTLKKRMILERERSIKNRGFQKVFIDFLYNIRSIKKMNLLKFTEDEIDKKAKQSENTNQKVMHYNSFQWFSMEFFIHAQFLIPLTYFILQLIQTGTGIEVIVMLVGVQGQMGEIGRQMMHMMSELASSKQEFELLAEHLGESAEEIDKRPYKKAWHSISFKNTFFNFVSDQNKFEHKINDFVINRGDHIAVMGKSGEGKSTFLNILTRQYKVLTGEVKLDNTNYNDVSQKFFDNEFTYISQDIELFDMTLYDNITMGKKIPEKTFQKIIDGCCLNELIKRMDGNPHTDIGEKGVKVSGGEKQRINLARGLLLDRNILVLDEITANLDPVTTSKIWKFIFKEYSDKTIIAISHEPELVKHVNKKLFFKNGMGVSIK